MTNKAEKSIRFSTKVRNTLYVFYDVKCIVKVCLNVNERELGGNLASQSSFQSGYIPYV